MDKVYQVFVSSTFSDLQDERKQVSDTLAKAGFIPSGMELFPAADQQQLEFIKRVIDRCDYYVVIVGAKYGSLDGDKSFTEKEYEYALEKKIPVLAFLHKTPGKIAAEKTERDPQQVKRLEAFKARLRKSRLVSFWSDINDLRTEVLTAVTNAVTLTPGIGWVRGDQAIDPKLLQELERLRIENRGLQKRLDELDTGEITFPPELLGPDDSFSIAVLIEQTDQDGTGDRRVISKQVRPVSITLGQLFLAIYDSILQQPREYELANIIGRAFSTYLKEFSLSEFDLKVAPTDVKELRDHYEALGLIQALSDVRETTFGRRAYIAWNVSEKGRRYATTMRAKRRPTDKPPSPAAS